MIWFWQSSTVGSHASTWTNHSYHLMLLLNVLIGQRFTCSLNFSYRRLKKSNIKFYRYAGERRKYLWCRKTKERIASRHPCGSGSHIKENGYSNCSYCTTIILESAVLELRKNSNIINRIIIFHYRKLCDFITLCIKTSVRTGYASHRLPNSWKWYIWTCEMSVRASRGSLLPIAPETWPPRHSRIHDPASRQYAQRTPRPVPPAHSHRCHSTLSAPRFESLETGVYGAVYSWPTVSANMRNRDVARSLEPAHVHAESKNQHSRPLRCPWQPLR